MNQTFTITFGDQAENHKGMQKIGELSEEGFDKKDLLKIKKWFTVAGAKCKIIHVNDYLETNDDFELDSVEDAYILIVKKGLNYILEDKGNSYGFYNEQNELDKDKFALMYGRKVQKKVDGTYVLEMNHKKQIMTRVKEL